MLDNKKDEKEKILFHVGYEWWMFSSTYNLLNVVPTEDDPVRNALVESLLIHGRALIDFFYEVKSNKTDWIVSDLGHELKKVEISDELKNWRVDTNKRVAHITKSRAVSLKEINVQPILKLLKERIECVRTACDKDMPIDWIGDRSTTSALLGPTGPKPCDAISGPLGPTGPAGG